MYRNAVEAHPYIIVNLTIYRPIRLFTTFFCKCHWCHIMKYHLNVILVWQSAKYYQLIAQLNDFNIKEFIVCSTFGLNNRKNFSN